MEFKKATQDDLEAMMAILEQGKAFLRSQGIDQWQRGYPDRATLADDIAKGDAYVLVEDGVVVATATVPFADEPYYAGITDGAWKTTGRPYAVIHRMAVSGGHKGRGIASAMLREIDRLCEDNGVFSIKVDTHPDNKIMQNTLRRHGFEYCGIVDFEGPKLAYEKMLD